MTGEGDLIRRAPDGEGRPLAIDLFCGLGGWTEGLLAEGYRVIGFDIEAHEYGDERYPAELVLADVLDLNGSRFAEADLIVASPPCQFFSYTAMPWSRAKALAAEVRADPEKMAERLALFNACFRIQREASEAAGRHIPMVVENVRGANPWVGRARANYGSFYLWGDVPALLPKPVRAVKVPTVGAGRRTEKGNGECFTSRDCGTKNGSDWFGSGANCSAQRRAGSGSKARKAAAAMIAKIPLTLSRYIAAHYRPTSDRAAA